MIRPLRQLHRFAWPVIAIGGALVLFVAIQTAPSSRNASAIASPSAAKGKTVVIGSASFLISLEKTNVGTMLFAQPTSLNQATTGRVAVTIVGGTATPLTTSLTALRRGYSLPAGIKLPISLSLEFIDKSTQTIVLSGEQS